MRRTNKKRRITAGIAALCLAAVPMGMSGCRSQAEEEEKKKTSFLSRILSTEEKVTLKEGTPIRVRMTTAVSTKAHKAGDEFLATLAEPVLVGEKVVAPRGARIEGMVASSDPGGRVKGRAQVTVRLTKLETADDGMVDIHTNTVTRVARSTKKRDAAKIGIGSGVGAAIGAIAGGGKGAAIGAAAGGGAGTGAVLATRGAPAVIPSEALLTFVLSSPVEI